MAAEQAWTRWMRSAASFVAVIVAAVIVSTGPVARAQDADAMLKEADKVLRKAQNNMFNGKNEEALTLLEQAEGLIADVEKAAPDHARLSGTKQKAARLRRDLERKLGKTPGTGDKPPPPTEPGQKPPDTPAAGDAKLPYHARVPAENALRELGRAESTLSEPMPDRDDIAKMRISSVERSLASAEKLLTEAEEAAAKEGVDKEHPTLVEIRDQIETVKLALTERQAAFNDRTANREAAANQVEADIQALRDTRDRLEEAVFGKLHPEVRLDRLENLDPTLAALTEFEGEEAAVQAQLEKFGEAYGDTREAIDVRLRELGYTMTGPATSAFGELQEGIQQVAAARPRIAEELISDVNDAIGRLDELHDFFVLENMKPIRAGVAAAQKVDPDNPKVKEVAATLDQRLQEATAKWTERIDKRKWPSPPSNAPGNAKELAEAALNWFRTSPEWGQRQESRDAKDKEPRRPLAAVVTGPWSVQAKNLLGQPTMYGVPVLIAVQLDREKADRLVRVYDVTMRTSESANPKMEPPFATITVGNSFYIRPEALK